MSISQDAFNCTAVSDILTFCDFCKDVTAKIVSSCRTLQEKWRGEVSYHPTYAAVTLSALAGCQLCNMLSNQLSQFELKQEEKLVLQYHTYLKGTANFRTLRLSCWSSPLSVSLEPFRDRDKLMPAGDTVLDRGMFLEPLKAASNLGVQWIQECREGHSRCLQPTERHLPTRVLDVGGPEDQIFLRESVGSFGEYTILSHCWGQKPTLTTTAANLAQRKVGMRLQELPATFRDAVEVTRTLGVHAKMHQYYQNAFVTIGALDTKDSFVGFLHPREEQTHEALELSADENVYLRLVPPTVNQIYKEAVLETRAWCLQERMISTRILQFGSAELLWECNTTSKRERDREAENVQPTQVYGQFPLKRALMPGKLFHFATWYRIVEQYSKRALTYPADMLPAISSVSNVIQERMGHTYINGMWKEDLNVGFLWLKTQRGHATGAPTWSWASTTAPVRFTSPFGFSRPARNTMQVLSIPDESSRELRVRSRCRQVHFSTDRSAAAGTQELRYIIRWTSDDAAVSMIDVVCRESLGLFKIDPNVEALKESKYKTMEVLACLDQGEPAVSRKGCSYCYFLMLTPDQTKPGAWKRVGLGVSWPAWDVPNGQRISAFDESEYEELCLV